jgi:hypothetical protein
MGQVNPVEQEIMEGRIEELRHQMHVLERRKLKAAYEATHDDTEAEAEPEEGTVVLPVGAG